MTDPDQYVPDTSVAPRPWWRNKETVQKIGYILSALWIGGIVTATKGDTKHFLFNFIFTVPLVGWIIGLGIAAFLRRSRKANLPSD